MSRTTQLYLSTRLDGAKQYSLPAVNPEISAVPPVQSTGPDRTDRPPAHSSLSHCSVRSSDHHRPSYAKQYLSRYNDHVVGWASEESCFDLLQRKKVFPYSTTSRQTLGPTQPPPQWVQGVLSRGVKGTGGQSRPPLWLRMSGAVPARQLIAAGLTDNCSCRRRNECDR